MCHYVTGELAMDCDKPGKRVKSVDEVVAVTFLRALQQCSACVNHVTGQKTVLKTKMNTKGLNPYILHPDEDMKQRQNQWSAEHKESQQEQQDFFFIYTHIYLKIPQSRPLGSLWSSCPWK